MQLLSGWRQNLEDLLYQQGGLVLLHATLFVIGLIFGALALRSLDGPARLDLARYVTDAVQSLAGEAQQGGGPLFQAALIKQAKLLALLWLLTISLVGTLGVLFVPLYYGFRTGFTVAVLAAEFGGRGVLLAAAAHLPQNLLAVPAIILGASASVAFAIDVIRSWRVRRRLAGFHEVLAGYTVTLLSVGVLLIGAAVVEGYLTPALLRWASSLLP